MNPKNKLLGTNPNESTPLSRAIFFITIGVAFYMLDRFSLFCLDDYMYAYKFGTYEPIKTLKDIFKSQSVHYMQFNGRFLVHCVVQLFCAILDIEWFRLFNAILFVIFNGLLARYIFTTWRISIRLYVLISGVIWLFIPRIGYTILGNIACCVNYLWVGVAALAFIILWQKICQVDKQHSVIVNVGLGIVGVIIGSLQESFSIPIAGALFIYYCFYFKKFRGSVVWLVCGFWLGTLILVIAPSNFARFRSTTSIYVNWLAPIIVRLLKVVRDSWLLCLAVVIAHIFLCFKNRLELFNFFKCNLYLYVALIICIAFAGVIAYTGEHQLFCMGIILIVLLVRLLYNIIRTAKFLYLIYNIIVILSIGIYVLSYHYVSEIYLLREKMINNIKQSEDGVIDVGEWSVAMCSRNLISKRYTIEHELSSWMDYVSLYYTGDNTFARNYVPCAIDELLSILEKTPPVSDDIWYISDYYCYVIRTPLNIKKEDLLIESENKNVLTGEYYYNNVSSNFIIGKLENEGYNYYFYFLTWHNKNNVTNLRIL